MTTAELISALQATADSRAQAFGPKDSSVLTALAMLAEVKKLVSANKKLKKQLVSKNQYIADMLGK